MNIQDELNTDLKVVWIPKNMSTEVFKIAKFKIRTTCIGRPWVAWIRHWGYKKKHHSCNLAFSFYLMTVLKIWRPKNDCRVAAGGGGAAKMERSSSPPRRLPLPLSLSLEVAICHLEVLICTWRIMVIPAEGRKERSKEGSAKPRFWGCVNLPWITQSWNQTIVEPCREGGGGERDRSLSAM